ncbi:MAG TPA: hypothetical protein DIT95_23210 [Arenibacter sp.]|nr:hypothetical protein [Arenibacter sp.]|tara:strand:+ start:25873 stop:27321 length:1449 start_codon:yes stop_codon:yes gene_type:complete
MKNKKIFYSLLLLEFILFGMACSNDFLEETPKSQTSDEAYFQNEAQALSTVNAVYSGFASKYLPYRYGYIRDLGWMIDAQTDIMRVITVRGPIENLSVDSNLDWNNGLWRTMYLVINMANLAIDQVPNVPIDQSLQDRFVGESKFLRALAYYNLVQFYGPVPLRLTVEDARINDFPRTSVNGLYAQIKKDLNDAISSLPIHYSGNNVGRVTSGAAKALLGKVLLLEGNYNEAETLFKDLIDNHGYSLLIPYSALFDRSNENNAESIFEIQMTPGINGSFLGEFYGSRGVPGGETALGGGFGVLRQHPGYVDLFDVQDARRSVTVLDTVPNTTDPIKEDEWAFGKYIDKVNFAAVNDEDSNFYVIRLADIILCYAEALYQKGDLAGAIRQINLIRERARNSNDQVVPEDYPLTLPADEVKNAIRLERKLELGAEGHGFFDSKRLGTLIEDNARVGVTVSDPDYTWPIPIEETDVNNRIKEIID